MHCKCAKVARIMLPTTTPQGVRPHFWPKRTALFTCTLSMLSERACARVAGRRYISVLHSEDQELDLLTGCLTMHVQHWPQKFGSCSQELLVSQVAKPGPSDKQCAYMSISTGLHQTARVQPWL